MEPERWLSLELPNLSIPILHPDTFEEFDSNPRRRERLILESCWPLENPKSTSKDRVGQGRLR